MRIKEISVRKYGPLRDFHITCTDINLVFGMNEAGKTALVDAITDALFRGRSIFHQQERFRLPPSSLRENVRVLLEHSGKEYAFPGKKRFEEITNLSHYHLARLFIVRAGELDFKKDDEKWQEKVQEFLSGIPVKIERLKEKIAEEVGITPKGEWSDRKPEYKKSKVEEAEKRKRELTGAISRLQDIREKEKKLKEKKEEEKDLRKRREKIALLRSYLRIKKIKEAFENWRLCRMKLLDYERYLEEDKRAWQEEEGKLRQLLLRKSVIESQKKEVEKELLDLKEEEEFLEGERKKLLVHKDRIVALSLSEDARRLSYNLREIEEKSERMLIHLILGVLLSMSGVLLLFLTILKNFGLRGVFFFLLLLFLGSIFLFFWHLTRRKYLKLKNIREKILKRAKSVFEEVENLEDIFKKTDSLEAGISANQEKLSYLTGQEKRLKERLEDITSTLQKLEQEIEKSRERIKALQEKTGLFTLSQLEDKLKEKREKKEFLESQEEFLTRSVGTDNPLVWEDEAKKDIKKPDISEEELRNEDEIEKRLLEVEEEVRNLQGEVDSFIKGELGRLGIKELPQIWKELKEVEERLDVWYFEKEAARIACDVLTEVGREMEDILQETVSDDKTGVSFYFKRITSGKYVKVFWQTEEGKSSSILVENWQGERYPVEHLSSGTQDQLFFSLRLGILKKGFPHGTFILLDDAFLTSDSVRREKQVRLCKALAREGWQIFYFTVDEGLKDLFSSICEIEPLILS